MATVWWEEEPCKERAVMPNLCYVPMPSMGTIEGAYVMEHIETKKVERHKCPFSKVQSVNATRQNGPPYSKERKES